MELTSKQRAQLRGIAAGEDTIIHIGKDGITDNLDYFEDFKIVGGKTGYVVQAGSCAVSCGRDENGKLFICATGDASSSWRAIADHTAIYQTYCK